MDLYANLKTGNSGNLGPTSHQGLIPKTTRFSLNIYPTLRMNCKEFNFTKSISLNSPKRPLACL
jgi:hypothetical protein